MTIHRGLDWPTMILTKVELEWGLLEVMVSPPHCCDIIYE